MLTYIHVYICEPTVLKHQISEILKESKMEPVMMVMRRLERFGQVKRREITENIRAVAEMKMECPRERPR